MKNVIFLTLFLSSCLLANAQDYLQEGNACFDKGDYACALQKYNSYDVFDGSRDISAQIQKAQECIGLLVLADGYFKNAEYEKARDGYKTVLDKNPKDPYAKKQYDACRPVEPEMIFVRGGTFTMGCTSEQGGDCDNDEKPAHQVTLSDFYIGKYPVTQAQWKAVMGNNPSYFKGDNLPVEKVSWDDVQDFLRKLNAQTGKRYRLPTEAEWEYAARGGNQSRGYKYSGSNTLGNVAWYSDNSGNTTHAVGTKSPNESGIYDMSGNVQEWCSDWFGDYAGNAQTNPKGPSSGSYRVLRGGSWDDFAQYCRVSNRDYDTPGNRSNDFGFRLALVP